MGFLKDGDNAYIDTTFVAGSTEKNNIIEISRKSDDEKYLVTVDNSGPTIPVSSSGSSSATKVNGSDASEDNKMVVNGDTTYVDASLS